MFAGDVILVWSSNSSDRSSLREAKGYGGLIVFVTVRVVLIVSTTRLERMRGSGAVRWTGWLEWQMRRGFVLFGGFKVVSGLAEVLRVAFYSQVSGSGKVFEVLSVAGVAGRRKSCVYAVWLGWRYRKRAVEAGFFQGWRGRWRSFRCRVSLRV